jgi:hypothetical protein
MSNDKNSRAEKVIAFCGLWIARVALALLGVAGMLTLLGGVDPVIAYPVAVVSVGFLLKETL